jgi:hypothetical protein
MTLPLLTLPLKERRPLMDPQPQQDLTRLTLEEVNDMVTAIFPLEESAKEFAQKELQREVNF